MTGKKSSEREEKSVKKKESGKTADFMKVQTARCFRALRAVLVSAFMAFIALFVCVVFCTYVLPMTMVMLVQLTGVGYESNILDVLLVLLLPGFMMANLYASAIKSLLGRIGRWMWNLWVGPKNVEESETK